MPVGETIDSSSRTKMGFRFDLVVLAVALLSTPALSDLVLTRVDRRVSRSLFSSSPTPSFSLRALWLLLLVGPARIEQVLVGGFCLLEVFEIVDIRFANFEYRGGAAKALVSESDATGAGSEDV